MKWVAFAIAVCGLLPLCQWLRQNKQHRQKILILFGLLPFVGNPHIAFIDWAGWPGYVYGLQVTGLDILGLALLFVLPASKARGPFRLAMSLYFIAVTLSVFHAQVPMAATFYTWQLARSFLIFLVTSRACTDDRAPFAILTGMTIGLCCQAVLAVWQRFGLGILQVPGSFGDQNLLGLVSGFGMFPMFALLLANKRGWQTIVAPLAGIIIAVLTTSRATVGLAAIGLALVFLGSIMRGWTPRKRTILAAGVLAVMLISPLVIYSFEQRFELAPLTSADERDLFNTAASLILSDHPWGVGANNYVVAANSGGYMQRAGVPWGGGQRETIVHNFYWLTAAECGYFGILSLAILIFRITTKTFVLSWRNKTDIRGDILLGLGITIVVALAHAAYEWVFAVYPVQYMFAMTVGIVSGLAVHRDPTNGLRLSTRPVELSTPQAYLDGKVKLPNSKPKQRIDI